MSDMIKQAAAMYQKAAIAMDDDKELLKLKAEKMRLDTKYFGEVKDWQDKYDAAADPYISKINLARETLEPEILDSKAGVIFDRLEAIYKKGRKSCSWKSISIDLSNKLDDEEFYLSVVGNHTSIGKPSVMFKIN